MTPPVSTSSSKLRLKERRGVAVFSRVVRRVGVPAAVDDADPGTGQNTDGVRMVVAAGDRVSVELRRPGAFVPAVIGEASNRFAESFVASPPEMHGPVLPGRFRDRADAG